MKHTDIQTRGWIKYIPARVRPYAYLMRLDRPIGTWLLLLPALWAILLSGGLFEYSVVLLFAIGAIIMRGAGCVMNDIWDRDLDGQVKRTSTRPIPNGDVTTHQALIFLVFLSLCGLSILLQFNIMTIMIGVISVAFIIAYPLMKRITWWPQAFLGLTFNFGALMGWSAITGDVPWQPWALYASGFFWTLGYDTIYAMQDREDDALIGVKSSARYIIERHPTKTKYILCGFYGVHYILFMVAVIGSLNITPLIMALMTLPILHLVWQVKTLKIDNPQNALCRFKSNRDYGLIICAMMIVILVS
jgi:4-hydroxybenzoate polyprenyltransferase